MSRRRGLGRSDLSAARHTTLKVTVGEGYVSTIIGSPVSMRRPELAMSLIVKKRGVAVRLALWLFVGLFVMPNPPCL
jgi:hypothetical protein